MEVNEQVKKIVLDKSDLLFKLLFYLRENQDKKPGISKENLAKYLREQELSSRMTTFGIIDDLVREGILLDNKVMNYQSNLRINPEYDFDALLENILVSHVQELYLKIAKFVRFTRHEKTEYILKQIAKQVNSLGEGKKLDAKKMRKEYQQYQALQHLPQILNEEDKEVKIVKNRKKLV